MGTTNTQQPSEDAPRHLYILPVRFPKFPKISSSRTADRGKSRARHWSHQLRTRSSPSHPSLPLLFIRDHHHTVTNMFARLATSSVRIASRGTRSAATFTTEGVKGNDFKALRDATKQHAAGEWRFERRDVMEWCGSGLWRVGDRRGRVDCWRDGGNEGKQSGSRADSYFR